MADEVAIMMPVGTESLLQPRWLQRERDNYTHIITHSVLIIISLHDMFEEHFWFDIKFYSVIPRFLS